MASQSHFLKCCKCNANLEVPLGMFLDYGRKAKCTFVRTLLSGRHCNNLKRRRGQPAPAADVPTEFPPGSCTPTPDDEHLEAEAVAEAMANSMAGVDANVDDDTDDTDDVDEVEFAEALEQSLMAPMPVSEDEGDVLEREFLHGTGKDDRRNTPHWKAYV